MENGSAAHIDLPVYSPIYDAPPTCVSANENGCTGCLIPASLVSGEVKDFGTGSKKPFVCKGMAKSRSGVGVVTMTYQVPDATKNNSGRISVSWHAKTANTSGQAGVDF